MSNIKTYEFAEIKCQSDFCRDLMVRLNKDIQKAEKGVWGSGMADHCQKQDDIKRLRRELMVLSKLLNPWGD